MEQAAADALKHRESKLDDAFKDAGIPVKDVEAMREALKFEPIAFEGPYLTRDQVYAERLDRFR